MIYYTLFSQGYFIPFLLLAPRQCTVCGRLAKYECRDCFDDCSNAGLESTAFCLECLKIAHRHEKRKNHQAMELAVSPDFSILQDACKAPRLFMELFAVICIETSHYVAFVKCGVGHEAPWCFFDSMADRQGKYCNFFFHRFLSQVTSQLKFFGGLYLFIHLVLSFFYSKTPNA